MCAIFGIIGDCNKPLIKNMSKIQKHRGPDSSTFLINQINNFSIGMNRLAVIDKKKGIQPMFSWDKKIVCIFNGTIYNFKEIKNFLENLKKPVFVRMTGSGSVIVAYYQSKRHCELAKIQFRRKFKNYWYNTSKTI